MIEWYKVKSNFLMEVDGMIEWYKVKSSRVDMNENEIT